MISQTGKRWVSSPLGSQLLLALFRNNTKSETYIQIEKILKNNGQCKTENKIFYSDLKLKDKIKVGPIKNAELIDLKNGEKSLKEISLWIANKVNCKDFISKFVKPDLTMVLCNVSIYEDQWNRCDSKGSRMKLYNSFNYTEDIKYETRLLEFPMRSKDFKLVIIVPNEADVLCNLFNKLTNDGLTAAMGSIQPLFTTVCELNAPFIKFDCETENILQDFAVDKFVKLSSAVFGTVNIDEKGMSIKVVTCMFPSENINKPLKRECNKLQKTFFFAVVFRDIPIFIGQYFSDLKQ